MGSNNSTSLSNNSIWKLNAVTVAGGKEQGNKLEQLRYPFGLSVDDEQAVLIADCSNHRILKWKHGASKGTFIAGDERTCKLNEPQHVIMDREKNNYYIADFLNKRVILFPSEKDPIPVVIIKHVSPIGLALDEAGSLYVVDQENNAVRRYEMNDSQGVVVAGGNGNGNGLHQLSNPYFVYVDREQSVFVSDNGNHRIMKWEKGAKEGIVVAGGHGKGNHFAQLFHPMGIYVDQFENLYVADQLNHRIVRWPKGAKQGSVIAGGHGEGRASHQLNQPIGLVFDQYGNLYVADCNNHRVQKFEIENH